MRNECEPYTDALDRDVKNTLYLNIRHGKI